MDRYRLFLIVAPTRRSIVAVVLVGVAVLVIGSGDYLLYLHAGVQGDADKGQSQVVIVENCGCPLWRLRDKHGEKL